MVQGSKFVFRHPMELSESDFVYCNFSEQPDMKSKSYASANLWRVECPFENLGCAKRAFVYKRSFSQHPDVEIGRFARPARPLNVRTAGIPICVTPDFYIGDGRMDVAPNFFCAFPWSSSETLPAGDTPDRHYSIRITNNAKPLRTLQTHSHSGPITPIQVKSPLDLDSHPYHGSTHPSLPFLAPPLLP